MNTLMQKAQILKLGKNPVVVLPVSTWETIREKIEDMQEDLEMYVSKNYKKSIARARGSKRFYSSEDVYKKLGL